LSHLDSLGKEVDRWLEDGTRFMIVGTAGTTVGSEGVNLLAPILMVYPCQHILSFG
jgi:polynucleotide 5'-kinase involved in rRNA processing